MWQLLAQRSGLRVAQVAQVARRSCAHATGGGGGGAQSGSVTAGEQVIGLTVLFATILIPSSYIMANIKHYRQQDPE